MGSVGEVARTKAFDPEIALDRAMQTFWARGYAGTSTVDLVHALGINRSSLYSTFGSKVELYRQALERYGRSGQDWVRVLERRAGSLRSRLRDALRAGVAEDLDPKRSRGCFACNAAVELAPVDPEVRRLVRAAFEQVGGAFRDALLRARADGELAPETDVDAVADVLVVAFEGLHVVAKGTRDRRRVNQAIDTIVGLV